MCTALEQRGPPAQSNIVEPDVVTWMTSFSLFWVIRASRNRNRAHNRAAQNVHSKLNANDRFHFNAAHAVFRAPHVGF